MNNVYRKIPNAKNYFVTDDGYVFKKIRNFEYKQVAITQMSSGYAQVYLKNDNGKWGNRLLHILIAEAFVKKGKGRRNLEVNHIDGNKENNHYTNLEWVSHEKNMKKGWEQGLFKNVRKAICQKRKAMNGRQTVLCEADVRQIRHLRLEGLTNKQVGFIFDLHPMQISRIYNKRSFAHVV